MNSILPGMREAYEASATAWAAATAPAYEAMADVLISTSMTPLLDARVLDLGTGTGSAARSARRAGAGWVIGVDVALAMLRAGSGWNSAVVADVSSLPFADNGFDLVVAACCLGHLRDPRAALIEARRVAPSIVASAFRTGWTHPAKALVDAIAMQYGFAVPKWYADLKADIEPQVDDPVKLQALGLSAGYQSVQVTTHLVDVGLHTPSELTEWRLGMAHLAPFVAALDAAKREDLRLQCEEALVEAPPPLVPLMALSASAGE